MPNGKGDARRPAFIPEEDLGRRWHQTFGNCNLPSNPAVARSQIEAASGSQVEACPFCEEPLNISNKCHRASWQKNAGPRRK